ncbi:hypothetical protein LIER_18631 [Lithospermum erythrorhizon]|uniref:SPX domain-containing protein n=1 Tax=Lithospermum erythrorhizon TaxID=34254 RepID=A0AAV3QH98_LITER
MKFGKEFRTHLDETLPDWKDKYLCYKLLKKLLKHIPTSTTAAAPPDDVAVTATAPPSPGELQDWFVRLLNDELEKLNDFYVDKEEEFIIRFQELKERIERVKETSSKNGVLASESEFSQEIMDIRKDFVAIHGEMVLLKNYSSLNFAGLVKILKKYDKRTGGVLRLPFTQLALHQPFFTTEPLTRLVHECEENLELLFPLEAEVVEPTGSSQERRNCLQRDMPSTSSEATPSIGETGDIYRSTLAAMRTIQGLKRASSTYNPLSFSSVFGNQDIQDGAVTENSASDSPQSSQDDDEANPDVTLSPK